MRVSVTAPVAAPTSLGSAAFCTPTTGTCWPKPDAQALQHHDQGDDMIGVPACSVEKTRKVIVLPVVEIIAKIL